MLHLPDDDDDDDENDDRHTLVGKKKKQKIKGNPEGEKPTFDLHAHHTLVYTRSDCTH